MAVHTELGKYGEELAVRFLVNNGFEILHRNWRYSRFEIDIIAEKNGLLHIVEVKLRSGNMVLPEENVTARKIKFLLKATSFFLFQNPQYKDFRLNILSISTQSDEPEFFFIEDVYI